MPAPCVHLVVYTQAKKTKDGTSRKKQTLIINKYLKRNKKNQLVTNENDPYFVTEVQHMHSKYAVKSEKGAFVYTFGGLTLQAVRHTYIYITIRACKLQLGGDAWSKCFSKFHICNSALRYLT